MSGEVKQNTSVASGAIATAPSATESSSDPVYNTNPENVGAEWHNTTSGQIFICTDATTDLNKWIGQKGGSGSWAPSRAILGGGDDAGGVDDIMDYRDISSLGNATDFGNLTTGRYYTAAVSNQTRGVWSPGYYDGVVTLAMDYVTIATPGNATTFGNYTAPPFCTQSGYTAGMNYGSAGCSNASNDRGVWWGGSPWTDKCNTIAYITISSTGNTTDFGDMVGPKKYNTYLGASSNGTNDRGVVLGGYGASSTGGSTSNVQEIEYITITSTGNSTDFGDLTVAKRNPAGTSNGPNERCVIGGGFDSAATNVIEYITLNSLGNGTDFGNLLTAGNNAAGGATSNGLGERAIWMGGASDSNVIQYVTISTPGDAIDFGDLTIGRDSAAACSDANTG